MTAIEQEAASAAVAEVLDAAEAVIEWLGTCDQFDHHGNCQTHAIEKPCRVETLRALIATRLTIDTETRHLRRQARDVDRGRRVFSMPDGTAACGPAREMVPESGRCNETLQDAGR